MKVTKTGNLRIIVEPKELFDNELASSLIEHIKQRSDDIKSVYIEWSKKEFCSYCNREWKVNSVGCPICCLDATREYNNQ